MWLLLLSRGKCLLFHWNENKNHHLKLYQLPGDKTHTLRRAIHMSNQSFTLFWFRPILEGHDPILSLDSCISEYTWVHLLYYDQAFSTIKTTMPVYSFHTLVSDLLSRITWIILNFLTYYISAFIFTNLLTINIFFHLYQCSGVIILISCLLLPHFLIYHCSFTEKVDSGSDKNWARSDLI